MQDCIKEGNVTLPIGEGRFSPISISDVGEVVANVVLSSTDEYLNKTFTLTGLEILSGYYTVFFNKSARTSQTHSPEFLEKISILPRLQKRKRYKLTKKWEWSKLMPKNLQKCSILFRGIYFAPNIDKFRKELDFVSNDAQMILARAPSTFESVMTIHKNHFLARPPSICPL